MKRITIKSFPAVYKQLIRNPLTKPLSDTAYYTNYLKSIFHIRTKTAYKLAKMLFAFEEFQLSGKNVPDISKYGDMWENHTGMPGRAYLPDENDNCALIIQQFDDSTWDLIIENTEEVGNLLDLELSLFDWAVCAGWITL